MSEIDEKAALPLMHAMSFRDFAAWGMPLVAYVRLEGENGGWSIHSADGTRIGAAPNRDVAFAAIRGHDLQPQSVH